MRPPNHIAALSATLRQHGCTITPNSLELADTTTEDQWLEIVRAIGLMGGSMSWWIGDLWAFGEHKYGDRKAMVESDDWSGPEYQTCKNIASVCRRFARSRRRDLLSFRHHAEVAHTYGGSGHWGADEYLDWCLEPLRDNPNAKPRSVRELREEKARRIRPYVPPVRAGSGRTTAVAAPAARGSRNRQPQPAEIPSGQIVHPPSRVEVETEATPSEADIERWEDDDTRLDRWEFVIAETLESLRHLASRHLGPDDASPTGLADLLSEMFGTALRDLDDDDRNAAIEKFNGWIEDTDLRLVRQAPNEDDE
jgi:hypothetical protein